MPGKAVEIDTTAIDRLSYRLAEIGSAANTRAQATRFLTVVGNWVKRIVEERYRKRGPNSDGERWRPILKSSEARRSNARTAQKLKGKKLHGYSTATPLVSVDAKLQAVVDVDVASGSVSIGPNKSRMVKFGKKKGQPIDSFASKPELSGFAYGNRSQPLRDAYAVTPEMEKRVEREAQRVVDSFTRDVDASLGR